MTFLPVITEAQYKEYLFNSFTDMGEFENTAVKNMDNDNRGAFYAMANLISGISLSMQGKLDIDDMQLITKMVRTCIGGMYGLMDKEAERIALEKVGVKTNPN